MFGLLAAVAPGIHDDDRRFPDAIHDCTYGRGSNLSTFTPFSFINIALEIDLTLMAFRLSHTVSFMAENPLSHSAVLPGYVSAAASNCKSSGQSSIVFVYYDFISCMHPILLLLLKELK